MICKNVRAILVALCALAAAVPAVAQTPETRRASVSPTTTDLFLLTPSAPSATRSLVIDAATRAIVKVTAFSQDLTVTLISPNGTRYSMGAPETAAFESVITGHAATGGANYTGILKTPTPGTWQVEVVHDGALSRDIDVFVTSIIASPVAVALVSADSELPVGTDMQVALAAFDGTTCLRGVTTSGTVIRPDRSSYAVSFRDDGVSPDTTANDGIAVANVPLPAAGEYAVSAHVSGTASTGAFVRTAEVQVDALPRTAILDGTFTDSGVDTDGDGLFNAIRIAPRADIQVAATYTVSVEIGTASGKIMQRATQLTLPVGSASPQVTFPAEDIVRDLAADGPYTVRRVELDRHDAGQLFTADRRMTLGQTRAWRLQDFQRERLRLTGTSTATGIDTNGNSRFDLLRLSIGILADFSGSYQYSGTLTDSNGASIGFASGSTFLSAGTPGTINLTFNGTTIGENNVDGPYRLALLVHGAGQSLVAPTAFTTQAFNVCQFEGCTLDSTPPVLSVSVTPSVLTPVNHKLVQIAPSISVSDDQDPSPTVHLDSITSSEGDNVRGDGNTTDDIQIINGAIFLRAERNGTGEGRIYTLTWIARDAAGNTSPASATVTVPHDQGK